MYIHRPLLFYCDFEKIQNYYCNFGKYMLSLYIEGKM